MKQTDFLRQMAQATPDVTEHYVQHMDLVLENIAAQEKSQARTSAKQLPSKRLLGLLIVLFIMLLSLTAYALTQWRIFDQLSDVVGRQVSEEAEQLMQSNLHTQTINGVEITLTEAGYDGRTLLLQYSYIFPDIAEPLGTAEADGSFPLKYDALELMSSYGVDWWRDEFWINGESVAVPGGSGSIDTGSSVPGEILHTEYWRLDNEGVSLDGTVEISLPIGSKADGGFTFTFDTQDVQEQVITVNKGYHAELEGFSVTVTDAAFTPLMTYITLAYEGNVAPVNAEEVWPFGADSQWLTWVYRLQLVDQQGEPVLDGSYSAEGVSQTEARFYLPHVSESYDELWLAPFQNDKADMTQAIQIR